MNWLRENGIWLVAIFVIFALGISDPVWLRWILDNAVVVTGGIAVIAGFGGYWLGRHHGYLKGHSIGYRIGASAPRRR